MGFWVAMTMKGRSRTRVTPSTVTWRSSIASRSAACVFGLARLISSPSTTFAKIGPERKTKVPVSRSHTDTPVTSDGSRSGVNWIRWNVQSIERASDLASSVLPTPGTSSMSAWPPESKQFATSTTVGRLPWMTRSIFAVMVAKRSPNQVSSSAVTGTVPPPYVAVHCVASLSLGGWHG